MIVTEVLSQLDFLKEAVARLDAHITELMTPFVAQLAALDSGRESLRRRSAHC